MPMARLKKSSPSPGSRSFQAVRKDVYSELPGHHSKTPRTLQPLPFNHSSGWGEAPAEPERGHLCPQVEDSKRVALKPSGGGHSTLESQPALSRSFLAA